MTERELSEIQRAALKDEGWPETWEYWLKYARGERSGGDPGSGPVAGGAVSQLRERARAAP